MEDPSPKPPPSLRSGTADPEQPANGATPFPSTYGKNDPSSQKPPPCGGSSHPPSGIRRDSATEASLVKMSNRWKRFSKTINYLLKTLLLIPPIILGFPWLYVSAFVVERKERINYSWSEVAWRSFGGLSFSINAAIILACVFTEGVLNEKQSENLQLYGMGTLVFICSYSGGMSLLCISQALWGRYHEEQEEGGGVVAVKYFWRKILVIVGIDLKETDAAVNSSWVWSFSLVSCVIGAFVFSIYDLIDDGLNQKPVTGNCEPWVAPTSGDSMCGGGLMYALEKDEPLCCMVTIRPHQPVDYMEQAGAVFFFLYAILQVFATIFVWAENTVIDDP